eukprot:m.218642 g.218642  ORF g.218642 m.218642 type:complete len:530 (+) comp22252_c2_seq34:304-1893(+)
MPTMQRKMKKTKKKRLKEASDARYGMQRTMPNLQTMPISSRRAFAGRKRLLSFPRSFSFLSFFYSAFSPLLLLLQANKVMLDLVETCGDMGLPRDWPSIAQHIFAATGMVVTGDQVRAHHKRLADVKRVPLPASRVSGDISSTRELYAHYRLEPLLVSHTAGSALDRMGKLKEMLRTLLMVEEKIQKKDLFRKLNTVYHEEEIEQSIAHLKEEQIIRSQSTNFLRSTQRVSKEISIRWGDVFDEVSKLAQSGLPRTYDVQEEKTSGPVAVVMQSLALGAVRVHFQPYVATENSKTVAPDATLEWPCEPRLNLPQPVIYPQQDAMQLETFLLTEGVHAHVDADDCRNILTVVNRARVEGITEELLIKRVCKNADRLRASRLRMTIRYLVEQGFLHRVGFAALSRLVSTAYLREGWVFPSSHVPIKPWMDMETGAFLPLVMLKVMCAVANTVACSPGVSRERLFAMFSSSLSMAQLDDVLYELEKTERISSRQILMSQPSLLSDDQPARHMYFYFPTHFLFGKLDVTSASK